MRIPFVGQTYSGRSTNWNAQRCVNWYPELDQAEGKNIRALINTPGLVSVTELNEGPIRGMYVVRSGANADERLFVVAGNTLYELDTDFNATSRGTLAESIGLVSMVDNGDGVGNQLMLVDGVYKGATPSAYLLSLKSPYTLTTLTNPGGPLETILPQQCGFLDGYFIIVEQNTGRFYISDLYNGQTWDATDFATAEGDPDNIVGMIVDHRELWLFGETTTEVWVNTGESDFPFSRIPGAVIEWGCSAQNAIAKADNRVIWLGRNRLGQGHVLMAEGYQPVVVSTPAIEYQLEQLTNLTDAQAFVYQQEGHSFYVLTFPTDNRTFVFDISTGMWHERSSGGLENRWIPNVYAFFNGQHLVGDYRNGKIYKLSLDIFTEDGAPIHRMRRTQVISNDLERLYFRRLQVDFEGGVGVNPPAQGSDPKAMLRWSDDGGHTWSYELQTSIGKIGDYDARAIWRRLGHGRQRIFELKVTDPVKPIVIGARARIERGLM